MVIGGYLQAKRPRQQNLVSAATRYVSACRQSDMYPEATDGKDTIYLIKTYLTRDGYALKTLECKFLTTADAGNLERRLPLGVCKKMVTL